MEQEFGIVLAARLDLGRLGIAAGRLNAHAERAVPNPGAEGDGGDMALADPAQREDEADRAGLEAGLIPMADDAGVEQRRRLERIFLAEDAADQQLLILAE